MSTTEHSRPAPPPAHPHPALRRLDPLVGTWTMAGRDHGTDADLTSTQRFEWLDGGFFLLQHTDSQHFGETGKGLEVIGYDYEHDTVMSHYYDNSGNHWQYSWECTDGELTIWMGAPGSPAFFSGKFSEDGNTITGQWQWPGGGYSATLTRSV